MRTPRTEPNVLPEAFISWQEWRAAYDSCVAEYEDEATALGAVRLKISLIRLGFRGLALEEEMNYIKNTESVTC